MEFGVGEATVLNALASAFLGSKKEKPKLEAAYNLCSDIGLIAYVLDKEGLNGIKKINITLHIPMKPMLAQRVRSLTRRARRKHDTERLAACFASLLFSWPSQVNSWGDAVLAGYCSRLEHLGVTPDQALAAIDSCGADQTHPPSAPELAGLARNDPGAPTFDELVHALYATGGVIRPLWSYPGDEGMPVAADRLAGQHAHVGVRAQRRPGVAPEHRPEGGGARVRRGGPPEARCVVAGVP